MEKGKRRG